MAATAQQIEWTIWDWTEFESTVEEVGTALYIERCDCRMEAFEIDGQWHFSVIYPDGESAYGLADRKTDAMNRASENAQAHLDGII